MASLSSVDKIETVVEGEHGVNTPAKEALLRELDTLGEYITSLSPTQNESSMNTADDEFDDFTAAGNDNDDDDDFGDFEDFKEASFEASTVVQPTETYTLPCNLASMRIIMRCSMMINNDLIALVGHNQC
jgi:hypothetical protein